MCDSFRGASDVRYSRCRNRASVDVGLSVGISVTVGVSSNKVRVVVRFLLKTFFSKLLFKKKITFTEPEPGQIFTTATRKKKNQ